MGVVNKEPQNLGDVILRRKRFALSTGKTSGTYPCPPPPPSPLLLNQNRAMKKGIPCTTFPMMSNFSTLKSSSTGKTFNRPSMWQLQVKEGYLLCIMLLL